MTYTPEQLPDPRNAGIVIYVGGELLPRNEAKVSVFDSAVQGGDAVWEGLRVYSGRIFELDAHLDRMQASAKTLAFEEVPSNEEIKAAIIATLAANGMRDQAHIRLTLTRGEKITSGMDPRLNQAGCTLIVLAEWKLPVYDQAGIRLVTACNRRNSPQCLDSKIHHNNLLNNIIAKVEANFAGVDDALMLDVNGFISETNATNVFMVKSGELLTPWPDSCLPGITREVVLRLAAQLEIPAFERNLSLAEIYNADEVFVTGTMGELTPVVEIDGRSCSDGALPVLRRLQEAHAELTQSTGVELPG